VSSLSLDQSFSEARLLPQARFHTGHLAIIRLVIVTEEM
jgi:hypothetical protein